MKKTLKQLLTFLLEDDGYITIKKISEKFSWSKRATRNNLDDLDEELQKLTLPVIERIPRKGLRIASKDKEKIKEYFSNDVLVTYESDFLYSEERQLFILWGIICTSSIIKIDYLIEKLQVSRSSINSDLKVLRRALAKENLVLEFTKDRGFYLNGDEFRIRMTLLKLLISQADGDFGHFNGREKILYLVNAYQIESTKRDKSYNLNNHFSEKLDRILPENFSIESKLTLTLYIELIVNRAPYLLEKENKKIISNEELMIKESSFYELAKLIILQLEEECEITLKDSECYWLSLMMITLPSNEYLNFHSSNPIELEVLAYKVIESVSRMKDYPFYEDNELHYIIVSHLAPAIHRMEYNIQIKNPLLEMITSKYTQLNQTVKTSLEPIEKYVGISITNDEASFFTLYFASSMEKLGTKNSGKKNVVLVCNSGNAVSRLLQYKLLNNFCVTVTSVTSEEKLYDLLKRNKEIDLVITVVPLRERFLTMIDFIQISPLLLDKDMTRLAEILQKKKDGSQSNKVTAESKGYHLLDLLTKERFLLDKEVKNLDDLVIVSGQLLTKTDCTEEHYTTEMLNVIYHFNSLGHINIAPGIILPHAGISGSVKQPGISFVRSKMAISYQSIEIYCSFAMCTTNRTIHSEAIRELGILLNHKEFQNQLKKINSYEEFCMIVRTILDKNN